MSHDDKTFMKGVMCGAGIVFFTGVLLLLPLAMYIEELQEAVE